MKFFMKKNFLFKLIVALCLCFTIMNFSMTPKVEAAGLISALGGQLLDPIVDLILVIGDGVMEIIQKSVMGTGTGLIFDNTKGGIIEALKAVGKLLIAVVLGVAVTMALGFLASLVPVIGGIIAAGITSGVVKAGAVFIAYSLVSNKFFPDTMYLPTFYIGPEEIFSNKILLFDSNVFNPKEVHVKYKEGDTSEGIVSEVEWNEIDVNGNYTNRNGKELQYYFYYKDGDDTNTAPENIIVTSQNNAAAELKDTIAKWYYTIRNVSIIALLSILVYVGIRILLASVASDKAKYKQMLGDWVIAMCLILLMQYIMVFANSFVGSVVTILSNITDDKGHVAMVSDAPDKLIKSLEDNGFDVTDENLVQDAGGGKVIKWPTNLMGKMRVEAQNKNGTSSYVGYAICYVVLVMYTLFFTFTYLKRLLYILFLTVISPLVAMTYPLDKIRDGQAQAFNMWLKEYIYNLLIQPFHLLLYVIFVSMAFDLAGSNIIYSLVIIGFMIPAEKFLRKMFGFDKASTPGFLAGGAGAAMTISAVKSLAGFASGGKSSGSNKNAAGKDNSKIKQSSNNDFMNRSGNSLEDLYNDNSINDNQVDNRDDNRDDNPVDNRDDNRDNNRNDNPVDNRDDNRNDNPVDDRDDNPFDNPVDDRDDNPFDNPVDDSNTGRRKIKDSIKSKSINAKDYAKARWTNLRRDRLNLKNFGNSAKDGLIHGAKSTAKIGLGAAGAGIGIAAGIASGSPGDVLKYGISGAYAGSSTASGLANRAETGLTDEVNKARQKHEDTLKTQYGNSGYKEMQNKRKDELFKRDTEMRKLYAQKFDLKKKSDIDKVMDQAKKFREYGITDNEIIIGAMKLDNNREASKDKIAAAKLASVSKSEKDLDTSLKRYAKLPGISADQVKNMERNIRNINSDYLT